MEATLSFVQELSTKVTELIGFHLGADHIHHIKADGSGWHYYIEALKSGYPVLAMHYRGPLMLALPYDDYRKLEAGEITVDQYITNSHWNYGYFWGGGGLLSGGYWQPLERETGIHDTERIGRYLHILSCRTFRRSSGHTPTTENCEGCKLDATSCPFSPLNQAGSWENEVQEPDGRKELFKAVANRIQNELGFGLYDRMSHAGDRQEILLFPGYKPDTVQIYLSRDLLNDLLYHPEVEHDWEEMAQRLSITLAMPWRPDQRKKLDTEATDQRQFCLDFWGEDMSNEATEALLDASVDRGFISKQMYRALSYLNSIWQKARGQR